MGKDRELGIGEGRIRFSGTDVFGELIGEESVSELSVRRAEVEQTNSSVILGERLILKAYRRLQKGTNPDLEIGRYLTEEVRFENTPPLAGAIEYEGPDGETTTLGLLQGFVENQGDGWSYVLDYLGRYLEDRLVTSWTLEGEEDVEEEQGVLRTPSSRAWYASWGSVQVSCTRLSPRPRTTRPSPPSTLLRRRWPAGPRAYSRRPGARWIY